MIDLEKYGFEQSDDNTDEWICPDGFIIYAGIGVDMDGGMDVELLTLQEFLAESYEFRGTHEDMDFYLKEKLREEKLNELLNDE